MLGALPAMGFLSSSAKAEQFLWSQGKAPCEALQHSQILWFNRDNGVKRSFISGLVKSWLISVLSELNGLCYHSISLDAGLFREWHLQWRKGMRCIKKHVGFGKAPLGSQANLCLSVCKCTDPSVHCAMTALFSVSVEVLLFHVFICQSL